MKRNRFDNLVDGFFAIVLTLLVIKIRVPEISGPVTDLALWTALKDMVPLFASYVLAFGVLASYWTGHHFIMSMCAMNLTRKLAYINIPFLLFVALVPFTSQFLGTYSTSPLAVELFGINTIIIGIFQFFILFYVKRSPEITNSFEHIREIRFAYIRVWLPVLSACIAIFLSQFNTHYSIYIFILAVVFNLIPGSVHWVHGTLFPNRTTPTRVQT